MAVTSCCGCFDLKTGGQVLGWLNIVYCLFWLGASIRDPFSIGFAYAFLLTSGYVAWLYGIQEKKTDFMLPCMIWAFITTTILGIITVLVLIAAVFGVTAINGAIQSVIDNNPGRIMPYNATGVITEIIGFLWLILALVLVLNWHYTAVMWSLYNQMKGEMVELPSFAQPPFIQPSCGQPSFVQPSFTPPCSIQPSAPLGFECVQVVNQPPTK